MTGLTAVGDGRYTLTERIATGGMGEVWRATDSVLGREVAVKVLRAEYADDTTFRARLEAEARNAARLHHPGIAQVFDHGEAPPGDSGIHTVAYLVMELVPGEPLSDVLAREGALPPGLAADLVAQAAEAVDVAHRGGVVHRDVKPANLIVTPDDRVKVTDFGIARAADAVPLTVTGQVIGTPQYLSPEQARGDRATPASDVYSLGVVLYECLAGRRPFEGAPVAVAMSHLREPAPALPESVPTGLAEVCLEAMAKEPAERTSSAAVLAERLRRPTDVPAAPPTAAPVPIRPLTPAHPDRAATGPRRVGWLLPALAAVAVAVVVGAVTLAFTGDDSPTRPEQPAPQRAPVSSGPVPSGGQPEGESDPGGVGTAPAPAQDPGGAPASEPASDPGSDASQGEGSEGSGDAGRSKDRGKSDDTGRSDGRGRSEGEGRSGEGGLLDEGDTLGEGRR